MALKKPRQVGISFLLTVFVLCSLPWLVHQATSFVKFVIMLTLKYCIFGKKIPSYKLSLFLTVKNVSAKVLFDIFKAKEVNGKITKDAFAAGISTPAFAHLSSITDRVLFAEALETHKMKPVKPEFVAKLYDQLDSTRDGNVDFCAHIKPSKALKMSTNLTFYSGMHFWFGFIGWWIRRRKD